MLHNLLVHELASEMKNTRENKARQYMRVVSVCGVRAMFFYSAAAVFPNFQQSALMIGLYIRLKEVEGFLFPGMA